MIAAARAAIAGTETPFANGITNTSTLEFRLVEPEWQGGNFGNDTGRSSYIGTGSNVLDFSRAITFNATPPTYFRMRGTENQPLRDYFVDNGAVPMGNLFDIALTPAQVPNLASTTTSNNEILVVPHGFDINLSNVGSSARWVREATNAAAVAAFGTPTYSGNATNPGVIFDGLTDGTLVKFTADPIIIPVGTVLSTTTTTETLENLTATHTTGTTPANSDVYVELVRQLNNDGILMNTASGTATGTGGTNRVNQSELTNPTAIIVGTRLRLTNTFDGSVGPFDVLVSEIDNTPTDFTWFGITQTDGSAADAAFFQAAANATEVQNSSTIRAEVATGANMDITTVRAPVVTNTRDWQIAIVNPGGTTTETAAFNIHLFSGTGTPGVVPLDGQIWDTEATNTTSPNNLFVRF